MKVLNADKVEELTGYRPFTTFYQDFSIAEEFGENGIKDTYNRAFEEWKSDYKYLTEFVMTLNWKIFEHYKTNRKLAELYNDLWEQADNYALDTLQGEELTCFIRTTD